VLTALLSSTKDSKKKLVEIQTEIITYLHQVKVKVSLEQAMKAQRGSRGIDLLFP
jgi:hypothetical protein